jgi:hypothetical protein
MEAYIIPIPPRPEFLLELCQSKSSTHSVFNTTGEPYEDIGVFYNGFFLNKTRFQDGTTGYIKVPVHPSNKSDVSDTFDDTPKRDPFDPTTWPVLYLAFHITPSGSAPQHVNEMLVHVHYAGDGAVKLRRPLYEAISEVETEVEKHAVERMAHAFWPCNVSPTGEWTKCSGMTHKEMEGLKEMVREEASVLGGKMPCSASGTGLSSGAKI